MTRKELNDMNMDKEKLEKNWAEWRKGRRKRSERG